MTLLKKIASLAIGATAFSCTSAFVAGQFKSTENKELLTTKEDKGFKSPFMDWPSCCSNTDCSTKCCAGCEMNAMDIF